MTGIRTAHRTTTSFGVSAVAEPRAETEFPETDVVGSADRHELVLGSLVRFCGRYRGQVGKRLVETLLVEESRPRSMSPDRHARPHARELRVGSPRLWTARTATRPVRCHTHRRPTPPTSRRSPPPLTQLLQRHDAQLGGHRAHGCGSVLAVAGLDHHPHRALTQLGWALEGCAERDPSNESQLSGHPRGSSKRLTPNAWLRKQNVTAVGTLSEVQSHSSTGRGRFLGS